MPNLGDKKLLKLNQATRKLDKNSPHVFIHKYSLRTFRICSTYIPRTQMTLVLNGKGLVLGG